MNEPFAYTAPNVAAVLFEIFAEPLIVTAPLSAWIAPVLPVVVVTVVVLTIFSPFGPVDSSTVTIGSDVAPAALPVTVAEPLI